jgi:hypothetical protein
MPKQKARRRYSRTQLNEVRERLTAFPDTKAQEAKIAGVISRLGERDSISSAELDEDIVELLDDALEEVNREA